MLKYSKGDWDVDLLLRDLHICMCVSDIILPILPAVALKNPYQ